MNDYRCKICGGELKHVPNQIYAKCICCNNKVKMNQDEIDYLKYRKTDERPKVEYYAENTQNIKNMTYKDVVTSKYSDMKNGQIGFLFTLDFASLIAGFFALAIFVAGVVLRGLGKEDGLNLYSWLLYIVGTIFTVVFSIKVKNIRSFSLFINASGKLIGLMALFGLDILLFFFYL